MDIVTSFVARAETAQLMEPTDRSFDNPAINAQTTAMLGITFCQDRFDALLPQHSAMRLGVVRAISLHSVEDVGGGDLACRAPAESPRPTAATA